MKYPKDLVHKWGAKAGLLMYIAQELPKIPQMPMVVKIPEESAKEILKKAKRAKIKWPRIFRSSAVAELDGYEGDFPTLRLSKDIKRFHPTRNGLFTRKSESYINKIESSPQQLKMHGGHDNLPDKINVIIAEESPSEFRGTLIKHPNQKDSFLTFVEHTRRWMDSMFGVYKSCNGGWQCLKGYSGEWNPEKMAKIIGDQLEELLYWYDDILSLPLMDDEWAYQLEFGLDPLCLYQVRPFKKIEIADFKLSQCANQPIILGVTPKQGLDLMVEREISSRGMESGINPENNPIAVVEHMRSVLTHNYSLIPNISANIWYHSWGMLGHGDIKSSRKSRVSAYFTKFEDLPLSLIQDGQINLKSDGYNIEINTIK